MDGFSLEYENRQQLTPALVASVLLHLSIFFLITTNILGTWRRPGKDIVYSVSFESGDIKGGLSQVAKKESELPNEAQGRTPEVEQPKVQPTAAMPDLVIKEAEKSKPIPKATPMPKTVAEKEKKKEPVKKATPKATPTKKPTPKPVDVEKSFQDALKNYLGESTNAGGKGFGSAGKGGRGMGGGVVRPPEWFLYKDQLESFIKRGWKWHDAAATLTAAVSFNIGPDGSVSGVKIVSSSGNPLFDESVIRAVMKAAPVPPAPPHIYQDFSFVELEFKPE